MPNLFCLIPLEQGHLTKSSNLRVSWLGHKRVVTHSHHWKVSCFNWISVFIKA